MRNSRRISVQGGERDGVIDDGDSDLDFAAVGVSDGFRPRDLQRPQQPQTQSLRSYLARPPPSVSSSASCSSPDLRSSISSLEDARPSTSYNGNGSVEGPTDSLSNGTTVHMDVFRRCLHFPENGPAQPYRNRTSAKIRRLIEVHRVRRIRTACIHKMSELPGPGVWQRLQPVPCPSRPSPSHEVPLTHTECTHKRQ
jgi:hypothetical protein